MNYHCVPQFNTEDVANYSSSANRSKKSPRSEEDDIMELQWHNGQLVMHSQTQQRPLKNNKSAPLSTSESGAVLRTDQNQPQPQQQPHLFMQEDEMASWLHYPLNDCNFVDSSDFCADLIYTPNPTPCVTTATDPTVIRPPQSAKPPIPPPSKSLLQLHNFPNFSRRPQPSAGPSCSEVKKSTTVVDSNVTPRELRAGGGSVNINRVPSPTLSCGGGAVGREVVDVTVTSSPGCSSGSAEPSTLKNPSTAEMRKRKGKDTAVGDDGECQSEDVEFEPPDSKKQNCGSTSTKRSRAAEVHNLSERRRRDRINEKMKALQELIPRCNKSDKASMLDEAIEYLKSLQLQVQMMSMGCGMVPMMFPGVQQYMAPMGMGGFGMGMGMDMGMGMARPMLPFPNSLQSPNAAAHLSPRFPIPPFHIPTNQADPLLNTLAMQNPNQPRIPNFQDPAHQQHYMGLHQMQVPLQQHLTMAQPSTNKPSSSKVAKNNDKQQ